MQLQGEAVARAALLNRGLGAVERLHRSDRGVDGQPAVDDREYLEHMAFYPQSRTAWPGPSQSPCVTSPSRLPPPCPLLLPPSPRLSGRSRTPRPLWPASAACPAPRGVDMTKSRDGAVPGVQSARRIGVSGRGDGRGTGSAPPQLLSAAPGLASACAAADRWRWRAWSEGPGSRGPPAGPCAWTHESPVARTRPGNDEQGGSEGWEPQIPHARTGHVSSEGTPSRWLICARISKLPSPISRGLRRMSCAKMQPRAHTSTGGPC